MKTKSILSLFILALLNLASFAQSPKDINIRLSRDKTSIRYITLYSDNIVFIVNQNGDVRLSTLRRGHRSFDAIDHKWTLLNNVPVDYYDDFDSYTAGKLKSVGLVKIEYIDRFDGFDNQGKVKSIGKTTFTYNDRFDGFDNGGKLKSVGGIPIKYYDRFDGELNGKLKSIGNTLIKYYDSFDWSGEKGTIKSITGNTPNIHVDNLDDNDTF